MIEDYKINQAHRSFISNFRGPSWSSFFCLPWLWCHKQTKVRVYIYPLVQIFFAMFIFTRKYLWIPIPYTCYFSKCLYFYILRFDTFFKIKKLSPVRYMKYKIILSLMVRTYQVWQKLFCSILARKYSYKPVRTYVKWLFQFFYIPPVRRVCMIVFKKGKWRKILPETIHFLKPKLLKNLGLEIWLKLTETFTHILTKLTIRTFIRMRSRS